MGNIHISDEITVGEKYEPAMKITDPEEAKEYLEACVLHNLRTSGNTRAEAIKIEKANLGYYAGYFDAETRRRVEQLFNCEHPIFGPISEGEPTAEEAFETGKKLGSRK